MIPNKTDRHRREGGPGMAELGDLLLNGLYGVRSVDYAAIQAASWEVQAEHCVNWIRNNVRIQDDYGGVIPFNLYDYQEEHIGNILRTIYEKQHQVADAPEGMHTDKSRQMGDTWLFQAFEAWTLGHWGNFRALNISRKQEKVDDGGQNASVESLHGKILFIYRNLPESAKFPLEPKFLRLYNPALGGLIIGEAAVMDAGRGGTYLYGLWDETAATEKSFVIYSSWQQAVRVPFYLSTPVGSANLFAWLGKLGTLRRVTHHWTQHPEKSEGLYRCPGGLKHPRENEECEGGELRSPWYDAESRKMPPETRAQELDVSYEGSVTGKAFPEFSIATHGYLDMAVDPHGLWIATIDPGVSRAAMTLQNWSATPERVTLRVPAWWEGSDATLRTYSEILREWKEEYSIGRLIVVGDPSGHSRSLNDAVSLWDEMRRTYKIKVEGHQFMKDVKNRVRMFRDLLSGGELPDGKEGEFGYSVELEDFAERLVNAKWPTDSDGRVTRDTDLEHNDSEHVADSLTYGVIYYFRKNIISGGEQRSDSTTSAGAMPFTGGLTSKRF